MDKNWVKISIKKHADNTSPLSSVRISNRTFAFRKNSSIYHRNNKRFFSGFTIF